MLKHLLNQSKIEYLTTKNGVEIWIKRDDLIHEKISGNKLFKLKFNAEEALKNNQKGIVTFGGAFSNHIAATAAFCKELNLNSVGIIRGERSEDLNPTLVFAESQDMHLHFISREDYRKKNEPDFLNELSASFPSHQIVPEGGANHFGVKGAEEILNSETTHFTHIATAMGTGTTFAGIVKATQPHQKVIGIPIHKHIKLLDDILEFDPTFNSFLSKNFEVVNGYHFGGYAKWKPELIEFIQKFFADFNLKLDPVYTGKTMFALFDLIEKKQIESNSKLLFIHTGGLQGVEGFEKRFGLKLF